jgi:glycosyltransferase involved in cell wall biosynthesis
LYKNTVISVVVPAYNEERFIGQVLSTMPELVDRIVTVDDCSSDNTFGVASSSKDPRVVVIKTATLLRKMALNFDFLNKRGPTRMALS